MVDLLLFWAVCLLLARTIDKRTKRFENRIVGLRCDSTSRVLYWVLILAIIFFVGLRTTYNDTVTYKEGFSLIDTNKYVGFREVFRKYGGFDSFQAVIKTLLGNDPQNLLFISGVVTTLLYVPYIAKYSDDFETAMYWFITGQGMFCMAGIKQAIAMGIALYSLERYYQRKYSQAILLLWLAYSFHPFVVCLVVVPLLTKKAWGVGVCVLSIGIVGALCNLSFLFDATEEMTQGMFRDLSADYSINPLRVAYCSIPVMISFLYRNQINCSGDKYLVLGVNMNIVSFLFIFLGLFFSPIYMGRMSLYFDLVSFLATPKLIKTTIGKQGCLYSASYYLLFFTFSMFDLNKGGLGGFFVDRFHHISLSEYLSILINGVVSFK